MRNHATSSEASKNEALTKLRQVIIIMKENISDYDKTVKIRRIFSTPDDFKSKIFSLIKNNVFYAEENRDLIFSIYDQLCEYEDNGYYDKAKEEDKFKLSQAGYVDSRVVIQDYVEDSESYKLNDFLAKHHIKLDNFKSCVRLIEKYKPDLYAKYKEIETINKTKEIFMPVYYISEILEGIKTGTTSTGDSFDVYEFWKLNPFKVETMDTEMRQFMKKHDKFRDMSYINKAKNEGKHVSLNYADHFDTFVTVLGIDKDHTIKKYMDDNNIKSCTLTSRENLVNNFSNSFCGLSKEDVIRIVDYMEVEKIPFVTEAFYSLVNDYTYMEQIKSFDAKLVKELKRSNMLCSMKEE